MKKKVIFASALLSCLTAVGALAGGPEMVVLEPDYFSGFFVGGTGALHIVNFDGNTSVVAPEDVVINVQTNNNVPPFTRNLTVLPAGTLLSNNTSVNSYDGYYGVQAGIGKVYNHRWYTGFVGFGEWGSHTDTTNNSGQLNGLNVPPRLLANGNYLSSTSVKISNDYGLAFKPGILVAPRSMIYGKIGAVWSDVNISNSFSVSTVSTVTNRAGHTLFDSSGTFSGASSDSDNKIALLLGIGFEQFIYRDMVTFNVEYDYANYGSVSTTAQVTGQGTATIPRRIIPDITANTTLISLVTTQATAKAKISTLLAGLNFYFGSHWF